MTAIRLQGIRKTFGSTVAVDRIDLEIPSKSLTFLLGPSGCGKTTLLRMIAGFIEPTAGRIFFDAREVTRVPPNRRNTGMVFQSYALWPHMTVFDNVAFGLGVRKVSRSEQAARVEKALRLVQMQDYAQRKPNELSGGQQQRAALARALVIEPTVLLLDEPLSNLDAKLRLEMRIQIRRICDEVGVTAVYVTHDQKEALSMADEVAVLRGGNVVQFGDPRTLYERPKSRFVADFLGETNFLHGEVTDASAGEVTISTSTATLRSSAFDESTPRAGNVTCSIRPEALTIVNDADKNAPNILYGRRVQSIFLGEIAQHIVELSDGVLLKVLELNPRPVNELSEELILRVKPHDVVILPD